MNNQRFRVMAVDDDPDLLDLIKLSLEPTYDVVAIKNPAVALDYLDYIAPDIAVLDIMMPKITGYHIVEEMRDKQEHGGVPVIFLSAKDSPHDIRYGYKLGANIYLTKPFIPERLRRTVEIVLGESSCGVPRAQAWTLQEVEMRMLMKPPHVYESWKDYQESRKKLSGSDVFKLRRPLSEGKEDGHSWEG